MSSTESMTSRFPIRPPARTALWIALFLAGLGGWLSFLDGPEAARAWRAFLINFIFFVPLAAGLVVWSAVVLVSHGRWMGQFERLTAAGMSFALPSVAALAALWISSPQWAPWADPAAALKQGAWLSPNQLFGRDLAALIGFWLLAWWYLARRRKGRGKVAGGWLIVAYGCVFTLLAFDLVMALDPHWYSALFGFYFFVSGMYAAVAAWTLMAVWFPDPTRQHWHDLGKLVVTLSLLTTYTMFSQLIVIWYGNLPQELRYLAPRMNVYGWQLVSALLLATVYLGPLVLLLTVRGKKTPWYLGGVCLLLLAALWVERWWEVAPGAFWLWKNVEFQPPAFGLIELAPAVAWSALLALGLDQFYRRLPPMIPPEEGRP